MTKTKRDIDIGCVRYKSREVKNWDDYNDKERGWIVYAEDVSIDSIVQCIRILEKLRGDYDKYYEREALQNGIDHLERFLNS